MSFNLNNKIFISKENSANGEVSKATSFTYFQEDNIIWADYSGGDILKGSLIGKVTSENQIEFNYQHINRDNNLKAGFCKSIVVNLPPGKLQLVEQWQWYSGDQSTGHSQLIEQ